MLGFCLQLKATALYPQVLLTVVTAFDLSTEFRSPAMPIVLRPQALPISLRTEPVSTAFEHMSGAN